jgi:hypothetical protein
MGYAIKSEVYFATDLANKYNKSIRIKIGETTNHCRRDRQLDLWITRAVEVGGDKSYRQWVESCLRLYIARNYDCELVGTDTFLLKHREDSNKIESIFCDLVEQIVTNKLQF